MTVLELWISALVLCRLYCRISVKDNKKFELMLTKRAKAYSSSGSR